MQQDVSDREIHPVDHTELAPPTPKRSKRRIVLPVVIVLGLLVIGWAFTKWNYGRAHESTENASVDGHFIPVLAKVSGYVERVTAQENAHVGADSLLVQIDPAEYRMRLAQADADLAAAQASAGTGASTGQAEAQVQTASSQRAALGAQIDAARANAQKAHSDLDRYRELTAKQIVSKQQLDAAQAAADAADANVIGLERQAAAAGSSVTNAQAGVRLAEARLQAARAARDNAALQLAYTRVTAPAAGVVSRRQVEMGQLVQAGQPLLTIVSDSGVFVTANFKETQLKNMRPGQRATIDVDAFGGREFKGKVDSLAGATGARFSLLPPENATGNFVKVVQRVPVKIVLEPGQDPEHLLKPGMSVTPTVYVR